LIRYRARWLVPICEPPIRDGWVVIDRGRVVAFGRPSPGNTQGEHDLGEVAIMPGLVNAHTHLELSYLRDQVAPTADFVTWIRGVVEARRQRPDPHSSEILRGIEDGIAESIACGTAWSATSATRWRRSRRSPAAAWRR
jgi:cytosine/adenosine deaminase-related metal-dependent hydrolase